MITNPFKKNEKLPILQYVYIDNSILLTLETINKNGFKIIWEQQKGNAKQILCFNEELQEFKSFDKYIWSDENNALKKEIENIYYPPYNPGILSEPGFKMKAVDLWTPIKFKYTDMFFKILSSNIK